ncbi:MAG TPA: rhodanese-like domain-containing protein [Nitrospiria bacterium]|jgi:3-mercaptopyruvate sulfurtransferase SseA
MKSGIFIETRDLNDCLSDSKIRIIDFQSPRKYLKGHIPGAVFLSPESLHNGEIPDGFPFSFEKEKAIFSLLGIHKETRVIG